MYIEVGVLLIIAWFIGGSIYREKRYCEAATFRADRYNELVIAMQEEFGEYAVANAARKRKIALYCDPNVYREKWGVRMGW